MRALKRRFPSLFVLPAAGWIAVVLGWLSPATAQIPEGWEIRIIAAPEIPYLQTRPDINNRGQVVYTRRVLSSVVDSEIMLYDRGRIVPLTNDDSGNVLATINNHGHVAWLRGRHHSPASQLLSVVRWRNGILEVIAEEPDPVGPPDINDNGWLVWHDGATNTSLNDQVWLYDGQELRQITNSTFYNQSPRINQRNQFAWNQFDYRPDPWLGSIMAYLRGFPEMLSPFAPGRALGGINDLAAISWDGLDAVQVWNNGTVTTLLKERAVAEGINNHGDVCIARFNSVKQNWMQWLYTQGTLVQITDAETGGGAGSINDRREIAFQIGRQPYTGIALFTHPRFDADADFDADVDLHDYALFQNCFGTVYDGVDDDCRFTDANNDQGIGLSDAALLTAYFTGPE